MTTFNFKIKKKIDFLYSEIQQSILIYLIWAPTVCDGLTTTFNKL